MLHYRPAAEVEAHTFPKIARGIGDVKLAVNGLFAQGDQHDQINDRVNGFTSEVPARQIDLIKLKAVNLTVIQNIREGTSKLINYIYI